MAGLFGTDGIRGKANQYPMTPEVALRAGRALAGAIRRDGAPPRILIGRDTRNSGDMIACALAAGICSAGGDAQLITQLEEQLPDWLIQGIDWPR